MANSGGEEEGAEDVVDAKLPCNVVGRADRKPGSRG